MQSYNFELSNNSYANQVMQKSGANGVSLFLFDNSHGKTTPVSFIYHKHLSTDALNNYATNLYHYDPLIPGNKSIYNSCTNFTGVTTPGDIKKTNYLTRNNSNNKYWNYFSQLGFHETGASYKAISPNIYLVIGLNLIEKRRHLSVESAVQHMENWLQESCDYIIDFSVRNYNGEFLQKNAESCLDDLSKQLTNREFQVVCELLQGKSNKQIAHTLSLSEYTIENYLRRIYKKFNVRNRTSLMATVRK